MLPIGIVRNKPFEARGLTDPWRWQAEFYLLLRSGDRYIQAPRVCSIEWSDDRMRWELRCEDMCALATGVFNGALILDYQGQIIARREFKAPVCVCNGDVLRLTVSLEYPHYERIEVVVDDLQQQYREKYGRHPGYHIKLDPQVMVK